MSETTAANSPLHTGGGAHISGDVHISSGDFVGRDKIIYIQYDPHGSIPPPPEPVRPPELIDFVGREVELVRLANQLNTIGIVAITGIAGAGKTALAARLATQVCPTEEKILWYKCYPGESVHMIIWAYAGFLASKGEQAIWEDLSRMQQSGGLLPANVLISMVLQRLRGQRYLLCFDNIHHLTADPHSVRLFDQLRELAEGQEIKLILTSQQEIEWELGVEDEELAGLSQDDSRLLLTKRGIELDEPVLTKLYQQTEGNPQLLILASQALLLTEDKAALVDQLVQAPKINDFLSDLIHSSLDEEARSIMRGIAALLGWPGTADAIEEILDSQQDIRDELDDLCDQFLLRQRILHKAVEYDQHNTVRAYYYERLTRRQRRQLHQRSAAYYQEVEPDNFKSALHYLYAQEYEHAAKLATTNVRSQLNIGRAAALRTLLENLTVQQLPKELWIEVCIAKGQTYEFLQLVPLSQASFEEALNRLDIEPDSPTTRQLKVQTYRGLGVLLRSRSPAEARTWLQQGLDVLAGADPYLEADLLVQLGVVQMRLGETEAARSALERALGLLPHSNHRIRLLALLNLGYFYYYQDDLAKSADYITQALAMAKLIGDFTNTLAATTNLAAIKHTMGDLLSATQLYEQAEQLAKSFGNADELGNVYLNSGILALQKGEQQAARKKLTAALDLASNGMIIELQVHCLTYLGELDLIEEQIEQAYDVLIRAEEFALEHKIDYLLPFLHYVQARYFLKVRDHTKATSYAKRAIEMARKLGMKREEDLGKQVLKQMQTTFDEP